MKFSALETLLSFLCYQHMKLKYEPDKSVLEIWDMDWKDLTVNV
jgi:hypothetical protein